MNNIEILENIARLKKTGEKVYSNCFLQFGRYKNKEWDTICSEKSFYIINLDHGIERIWFFTIDFSDLDRIINNNCSKEEYILEIQSKQKTFYQEELGKIGFKKLTRMKRLSNSDISSALMKYYNPNTGVKANINDAEEIHEKLWSIFDTRVRHLLSLEELKTSIQKGEVSIQRNKEKEIVAILQRIIEPKCFYINQIYNHAGREIIHAILLNELLEYCKMGGRYVYAWVEETNTDSCKFHKKYGLTHGGLWNTIYKWEKSNMNEEIQ